MSYGPGDERSREPVNHQLLPLTSTPAPSCGEPDLPPPRCCNSLAKGEVSRSLRQQRTPRAPRAGLGAPGEPQAEPPAWSALLVPLPALGTAPLLRDSCSPSPRAEHGHHLHAGVKKFAFHRTLREAFCIRVTGWRHWWDWEEARSRASPSRITAP